MTAFDPAHLAQITKGRWKVIAPGLISGFSFDSRRVGRGQCFVALKSESRDGHDFVGDAAARGASCVLASRVLDADIPQLLVEDTLVAMGAIAADVRRSYLKPVIGITGSCGKTSTKEMLRLLLGKNKTHATAGNWNNRIGVPMTLFELDPGKHEFAVIEAGINQPGEMAMLGEMIAANLTILTNIGPAHLELLSSLEGIAAEKSKLAEFALADSPLVLPAETLQYPALAALQDRCIVLAAGGESVPSGVRRSVRFSITVADGGARKLTLGDDEYLVHSSSIGIATNAGLALIAAEELGVDKDRLGERLEEWRPESTRGRVVSSEEGLFYIDCYNANPASMKDALSAFMECSPAKQARCFVLGAMNELGSAAEEMHRLIGQKVLLRPQDCAYFVGPKELAKAYLDGALLSGASVRQLEWAENVDHLKSLVADFSGSLFLKGSRSYQLEKLLPESVS
ncbi:MAG: UDP-N-acetylmuramoyl-tripeptide--D-alanyl-D-alanine ligase [Opitutales bacterium]